MVAFENLAPSKNLAPICPSENSAPTLIVRSPLSFWNLGLKADVKQQEIKEQAAVTCNII